MKRTQFTARTLLLQEGGLYFERLLCDLLATSEKVVVLAGHVIRTRCAHFLNGENECSIEWHL